MPDSASFTNTSTGGASGDRWMTRTNEGVCTTASASTRASLPSGNCAYRNGVPSVSVTANTSTRISEPRSGTEKLTSATPSLFVSTPRLRAPLGTGLGRSKVEVADDLYAKVELPNIHLGDILRHMGDLQANIA